MASLGTPRIFVGFARHVGAEHQGKQVSEDPRYVSSVEERLQPVARVAVAGQDNSALKIEASAAAAPAAAIPKDGTAAYETACQACHGGRVAKRQEAAPLTVRIVSRVSTRAFLEAISTGRPPGAT